MVFVVVYEITIAIQVIQIRCIVCKRGVSRCCKMMVLLGVAAVLRRTQWITLFFILKRCVSVQSLSL